jgi:hypothetical protein
MKKILLVRTGDMHPAHTLTYYAMLGLTPEPIAFIKDNFNTAGAIPYTEAPVFFLDDAMNSTVAKARPDHHGAIWDFFRQIDDSVKIQVVTPEYEEIFGYDSDQIEANALELSADHELEIQYKVFNTALGNPTPYFRFWAHVEADTRAEQWGLYTEWIPMSILDEPGNK